MVTSNKQSDKKVVKMAEQNNVVVVPQRTLLGEVNEHITCPLCRGYYIDATTIVECLHSFCRSCIIKHLQAKSYCPVCEMMINSAKPNIKLDKALQDIVYKLVPGLFQKEMERRQQFYSSRPGPAASATPEQRGEDTERIIFSPEDVISFSLEYCDVTDTDSISSKSSDSSELSTSTTTRRYLQCPAVVNISHLKKFLSMKFDIDSTQFAIDILYKRVPLPDYYTLMDIAYIYNWKRNEPMRFFYQITDYIAIRNRLFEINRKSVCPFGDRKSSPAPTEDTNASSPAPHLHDQGSEASSGTDSPMPDEGMKQVSETLKVNDKVGQPSKLADENMAKTSSATMSPKKKDDEVEKSQFLNSFELTAKNNCVPVKSSPVKSEEPIVNSENLPKTQNNALNTDEKSSESSKRKYQSTTNTPEMKKLRVEIEKAKIANLNKGNTGSQHNTPTNVSGKLDNSSKGSESISKPSLHLGTHNLPSTVTAPVKDAKQQMIMTKQQESLNMKRMVSGSSSVSSPKRKTPNEILGSMQPPAGPKTVSPLKLPIPKLDASTSSLKSPDVLKPPIKKMPDLKPSIPMSQSSLNKVQPVNKVRMDLLANNSDPTCDRSKILSQVKTSLGTPTSTQPSGDPLKSLFDSCKINIPSSLSITLTDQKLDAKNAAEITAADTKKNIVNKNLVGASNTTHKVPSPPVHNYIEILKLPDSDPKKLGKPENSDIKTNQPGKTDGSIAPAKPATKTSENSAKGPIPNLKPIADTKLAKQSGNFSAPITFQQTFEQQLQSLQSDKKGKLPKNKAQVPKLVPATPKSLSSANKPTTPVNKPVANSMPTLESKSSAALDLSTPHNIQSPLLTMQSIDNLAKKQSLPNKGLSHSVPQSNVFPGMANRPLTAGVSQLRIPTAPTMNLMKPEKSNSSASQMSNRLDMTSSKSGSLKSNSPSVSSPGYQIPSHSSPSAALPSPRSQTRSPSSSPKLVIVEEKQATSSALEQNINQSNQITSTQISNMNSSNNDHVKVPAGPSKTSKPMSSIGKMPGIRQPLPTGLKSTPSINSADYLMSQARPQLMAHHQSMMQLRHQMEMNAWAQRQIDMYKRSNMAHQIQNDFNNKEKQ